MDPSKITNIPQSSKKFEENGYIVTACAGTYGCPLSLVNGREGDIGEKIVELLDSNQVNETILDVMPPIRLKHHKLKVSISGCPNACSKPHIADIGIIVRVEPILVGKCTECGVCLRPCMEDAIDLEGGFNLNENCIDCGLCIDPCPIDVLEGRLYFEVLLAGKLGRHPTLAKKVAEYEEESDVYKFIGSALKLYTENVAQNERLTHTVLRMGLDNFIEQMP